MPTEAAAQATNETPKTDAMARTTSADSIRQELDKVQGQGLPGARGALGLASQGVVLNNLDDAWRFATLIQSTGLAPKSLDTPAKILLAMQMGMELGLPPMASIENIAVVNGRPSVYGDICLGLVRNSGFFDEAAFEESWDYEDGKVVAAHSTMRRLPNGQPRRSTFTWQEALDAGLTGKDNYKHYRKAMLMWRARHQNFSALFSDVLKGVVSREVAQDLPPRNVTPEGPTTATSSPTSLDELTEQLNGSVAAAEAQATEQQETTAPAPETTQQTTAQPSAHFADILEGLKDSLAECKYVTDVTKQRNLIVANSSLTEDQRKEVEALCEARATEIKNAKRGGEKGQPTLV